MDQHSVVNKVCENQLLKHVKILSWMFFTLKHNANFSCGGLLYAIMQHRNILYQKFSSSLGRNIDGQFDSRVPSTLPDLLPDRDVAKLCCLKAKIPILKMNCALKHVEIKAVADENLTEVSDEDDDLCPVECVREFKTDEEFLRILEKANETNSLVVVDFYRTSCGSCKYIEQGFAKLCKGSGDEEAPVIFLKHNVIDEYDEPSEVAERLRIKAVPLFHFYKNGRLLEAFPTRDKERIVAAILKYTAPASPEV